MMVGLVRGSIEEQMGLAAWVEGKGSNDLG